MIWTVVFVVKNSHPSSKFFFFLDNKKKMITSSEINETFQYLSHLRDELHDLQSRNSSTSTRKKCLKLYAKICKFRSYIDESMYQCKSCKYRDILNELFYQINLLEEQQRSLCQNYGPNNLSFGSRFGNIDEFLRCLKSSPAPCDDIVEIGRGGYGIVYYMKNNPYTAYKTSPDENVCSTWKKEFLIHQEIQRELSRCDLSHLSFISFVFAVNYDDGMRNGSRLYPCAFSMNRVIPYPIPLPVGIEHLQGEVAIHPIFGENRTRYTAGRGYYVGYNILLEIFGKEKIKKMVSDLTTAIALIHYCAKFDAYDYECYLGENEVLHICDLNLFEPIKFENSSKHVTLESRNKMVSSLNSVSYLPIYEDHELYNLFRDTYLTVARSFDNEENAIEVIENLDVY